MTNLINFTNEDKKQIVIGIIGAIASALILALVLKKK